MGESFRGTFVRLLLSIVFLVSFKFQRKSKQLLMVVGIWILFVQIIKISFQGEILASMQALPEERVKSIRKCKKFSFTAEYADRPKGDFGYTLGKTPSNFFRFELTAILRGHVICKQSRSFGSLRETLMSNIPMYDLKSTTDVSPEKFLYVDTATLRMNSRILGTLNGLDLDPRSLCCFRVAQLGLSHSVFDKTLEQETVLHAEKFRSELSRVMSLELSPSYHENVCKSFETVTLETNQTRRFPRRCFTWRDLRPRRDGIVILEDIVPTLILCSAFIALSFLCFVVQTCQRVCGDRIKLR